MAAPQRIPTVDDLRVKMCYICREEERYDNPEDPPRAWTHPCSCTLVAHESCLLQWIKAAQQDPAKVDNALKCPQCGATYELESDNPRILRALNAINSVLSAAGKAATVVGVVSLATSFGFTIYVVATSYGAFAVKEFLGEEMYNLLLTDDPNNWPWHAFIHLPIIPFSLVLSRTRLFDTFPIVPLFLTWSSSPPVRVPPSPSGASTSSLSSIWTWPRGTPVPYTPPISWPPTPLMAMVLLPFVRTAYRHLFDKLTKYVMGTLPEARGAAGPIRRVIWALNDDGPGPLRVRIGANIQDANAQGAGAGAPAGGQANADANADNRGNEQDENVAAVAERTLRVTTSSLGRFIGGALLIPTISARMGTLLFRLSKHFSWLRAFLAIRDHPAPIPTAIQLYNGPPGSNVGLVKQIGSGLVAGLHIMTGGTPTWNAADPMWWRNAVGLGLFVFAKDCVSLLHLYLTKRELESRRVKSRSFAGVDIRELDLIDRPLQPETTGAGADA
ncbi:hypothetical protein L226DRAFT_533143 [Lentinus tigrinus ALCF2SS1-7]|uniref:uncharacterized protein n=1 Tax=Lentinus tigrinus ALCF2SS1-7 TaxID=1328758 RepID=UPI0011661206|nr:hypothetical protein L226DRAFT_533143 [Lentinus tigrinus ALCF2SS1-7]